MPTLAAQYRVYAPDLPGFGDSDKPAVEYTPAPLQTAVGDLLDRLPELGMPTLIVWGTEDRVYRPRTLGPRPPVCAMGNWC